MLLMGALDKMVLLASALVLELVLALVLVLVLVPVWRCKAAARKKSTTPPSVRLVRSHCLFAHGGIPQCFLECVCRENPWCCCC